MKRDVEEVLKQKQQTLSFVKIKMIEIIDIWKFYDYIDFNLTAEYDIYFDKTSYFQLVSLYLFHKS